VKNKDIVQAGARKNRIEIVIEKLSAEIRAERIQRSERFAQWRNRVSNDIVGISSSATQNSINWRMRSVKEDIQGQKEKLKPRWEMAEKNDLKIPNIPSRYSRARWAGKTKSIRNGGKTQFLHPRKTIMKLGNLGIIDTETDRGVAGIQICLSKGDLSCYASSLYPKCLEIFNKTRRP